MWLISFSAPTERQRWRAATLTEPGTVLSHASAAAFWGLRRDFSAFATVTRPGSGGPRRRDGLLVFHSTTLAGDRVRRDGVVVTTVPRTIIDVAARAAARHRRRPQVAAPLRAPALRALQERCGGPRARGASRCARRPQWHRDPQRDAEKTAAWRAAGWDVRRIPSGIVFDRPEVLVEEATRAR